MYFRHIENAAALAVGRSPAELSRRQFLKLTTLAGSGLTLGMVLPGCGTGPGGAAAGPLVMPFVRIAPDNTVTVICKHLEAGQGVWTGLPAIVAEELDASWDQMRVESAPAQVPMYGNLAMGGKIQLTGGSTAVANSWQQLRQAGATARAMLVAAAAKAWAVPVSEIKVSQGVVSHTGAGRKATFGELAGSAAKEPVPTQVSLKDPAAFSIVGNEKLPRLDARAKSTGKQQFAIDVMLPGMMTALVMRPPRFGGKVSSFDASKAKAVPGVIDVVQIPRGVAVVGRDMWSAKKGREALSVTWDESGAEKRGTTQLMKEYHALSRSKESVTVTQRGDVEAALAHAVKRVEGEFEFPYLAHAPMEPLTAVCQLSADKCEIWAGCQFQTVDQANAAAAVGLKPEQVSINTLAVGGSAPEQYDLADAHVSWSPPTVGVPVLWWRSVENTHMAFSKEVMIDELAHAARQDPVTFRLALLGEHPRHVGALKLAAEKAGWDSPFSNEKGRGRGVAVHESFGSVVAQVAEVTVSGDKITVDRVVCAVDCGIAVTPDVVKAQMQSGIGYGLSAALYGKITLTDGHVDQTNFHQYQVLRINDMPRAIEVYIVPSTNPPSGVGEPGVPPIAPAVANAVRAATGTRLRTLPFHLAAARRAKA